MICFTESHKKDISISLTKGQHQLFIHAYSKNQDYNENYNQKCVYVAWSYLNVM